MPTVSVELTDEEQEAIFWVFEEALELYPDYIHDGERDIVDDNLTEEEVQQERDNIEGQKAAIEGMKSIWEKLATARAANGQ